MTASGAGSPYVQLLKQMGAGMAESGQHVNYVDVAPMTAKDPTGSAVTALALPMIFGGMSTAAIFSMLFISNPLSGMATGMHWLPSPWGAIGQYLPLGAAGTALRSSAFFNGAGMTNSVIVLLCWIIAGITLAAAGAWRARRTG